MSTPDRTETPPAAPRVTNSDMRDMIYRAVRDYCECCAGGDNPQFPLLSPDLFCEGFDEPPPSNQQFTLWVKDSLFTVTVAKNRGR